MEIETPRKTPQRKTKIGLVVSDKMQKTVVVSVESFRKHPLYGRTMRRTRRFKAHDEENACHVGDQVEITERDGSEWVELTTRVDRVRAGRK